MLRAVRFLENRPEICACVRSKYPDIGRTLIFLALADPPHQATGQPAQDTNLPRLTPGKNLKLPPEM